MMLCTLVLAAGHHRSAYDGCCLTPRPPAVRSHLSVSVRGTQTALTCLAVIALLIKQPEQSPDWLPTIVPFLAQMLNVPGCAMRVAGVRARCHAARGNGSLSYCAS